MKLKKVHKTLEFDQECWMEPTTSDFEKNFYKLMNNSVFGKTMENVWKRIDIKIVRSDEAEKIRKLIASPFFAGRCSFPTTFQVS